MSGKFYALSRPRIRFLCDNIDINVTVAKKPPAFRILIGHWRHQLSKWT
ncbi:hypothetical protein J3E64_001772 [Sphingobium sp. OAS761]|nr:hypothetical protein [Sphingobium sp. OAS761]